jgi:flagellar L-ring protein FlgH
MRIAMPKIYLRSALSVALLVLDVPPLLAQSKESAAAATRPRMSWTSDRKEYVIGDVITVVVDEATLASATSAQNGSDQQTRKNGLGLEPPKIGTTALPTIEATMSSNKNAQSHQSGDAKRDVRFRGDISVRIVAVEKGMLQLKGQKVVDVDHNKQVLNFSGWVRPQDVSLQNMVASDRVADAQLVYALSGDIGKTRGGLIGRLINVFWP